MRRFAIVFDEFSIERQSVKAGKNSEEAVTACRCINVGLFVSGNLRRDVIVSIIVLDNNTQATIVTFNGSTLRRVSPDERSISFFLLKAFDAAENLE
jgi:tRNA (pseudouridine54-N1)-methyltransferase